MKSVILIRLSAILIVFTGAAVFAGTSSSSLTVTGIVPVILQVNITRSSNLTYTVRETSNDPDGYRVTLQTDAPRAHYDGAIVKIIDGQAILTQVSSQDKSVDALKKLVFLSEPSYIRIAIEVM
jgi:hypothetical protein